MSPISMINASGEEYCSIEAFRKRKHFFQKMWLLFGNEIWRCIDFSETSSV